MKKLIFLMILVVPLAACTASIGTPSSTTRTTYTTPAVSSTTYSEPVVTKTTVTETR